MHSLKRLILAQNCCSLPAAFSIHWLMNMHDASLKDTEAVPGSSDFSDCMLQLLVEFAKGPAGAEKEAKKTSKSWFGR